MRTPRRRSGRGSAADVPSITWARRALTDEIENRTSRYLFSMGIRTVCVVLAAVTDGPWRWVFLAGAILLPWIAVVLANAGRERARPPDAAPDPRQITSHPEGPIDGDRG